MKVNEETKKFIDEYCKIHIAEHRKNIRSINRSLKSIHNCFEITELKRIRSEKMGAIMQLESLRFTII